MNLRLAQLLALSSSALITLTALILVGYFTLQDYRILHREVTERSNELATALAQLVAFPLFTGDMELLNRHLRRTLKHPLVVGVEIYDASGRLLAREGDPRPSHGITINRAVKADPLDAGEEAFGLDASSEGILLGRLRLGISLAETQGRQIALIQQSVLILFLCLIGGGALSWWMGRRLARPIQHLSEAADALARGERERRVTPSGPREVAALGHHFNVMAEALSHAHEEMQHEVKRATSALQRSLHRLEEKNRELEEARRQAQAAGDAKGRFLANMSHEIRTPMNAIVGFTRLLYKSSADPAQRHHLLTIQHSAESLLTLIDDILELAQMEKGNVHLRAVDFDLRVVLDDICALLAPLAHEKQLELALLIQEEVPTELVGDPCRLKQILNNLIGNAIKYTPSGEVLIRVNLAEQARHGVMLKFTISDTGIGIDKAQRERIFQAFTQGDEEVTRNYEGSGLGLAIARSLVMRMGGEIDFESQPGRGTTFWFTIWTQCRDERPSNPPLAGRRAALLEGHPIARLALLQDLERLGLAVDTFDTVDKAHNSPVWEAADVRLVGVSSPRRLTSEALRALAELADTPATLILANSASLADYQTLAQAGIPAPLNKPVPRDLLRERLIQLIQGDDAPNRLTPNRPALSHGRVLVCEDNAVNRALYLALFQELGAQVEILGSAEETVKRLEEGPADLIIMDVHMPGMSGLEAIRRIRALPGERGRLPIVCVSADVFSQGDCLEAGANSFLAKPIDEQTLAEILSRHLAPSRQPPSRALKERIQARLLPLLIETLPHHMETIERAWAEGNTQALRQELHKLEGACAYCRAPRLCAAVRALSQRLKEGPAGASTALEELRTAAAELLNEQRPVSPLDSQAS